MCAFGLEGGPEDYQEDHRAVPGNLRLVPHD